MSNIDVTLTPWERKTIIHALGKLRDRKRDYVRWLQEAHPNNSATVETVNEATLRIETLLVRLIEINRGRLCPGICPACSGTCIHCDPNSTCPGVHGVAPEPGTSPIHAITGALDALSMEARSSVRVAAAQEILRAARDANA